MNHLALTMAVEEPSITTVSVRPGVVDTAMQKEVRDTHSGTMDEKDTQKFQGLYRDGALLKPEQPGNVMARLVLSAPKDLSGMVLRFVGVLCPCEIREALTNVLRKAGMTLPWMLSKTSLGQYAYCFSKFVLELVLDGS
jgi:hypothetical protein